MKKIAALALVGMLWASNAWAKEDKQAQPQLDIYTSHGSGAFRTGGAIGIPILDFGGLMHSKGNVPLYLRTGLTMTDTGARVTVGGDLMSPWILFFRVQAGGGLEINAHSTYAQTTPYLRLGSQLWIFFSDLDYSKLGTTYRGGLRIEF